MEKVRDDFPRSQSLGIRESVETDDSATFQVDHQGLALRATIADSRRMGVDVKELTLMATHQTFRVDKFCPSDYSVRETWYGDDVQRQYLSTIHIRGTFTGTQ